jgi:hypothetical protein
MAQHARQWPTTSSMAQGAPRKGQTFALYNKNIPNYNYKAINYFIFYLLN